MTVIVSDFLGMHEAEETIAEIWLSVERYQFPPPTLELEFDASGHRLRVHLTIADGAVEQGLVFFPWRFGSAGPEIGPWSRR